MKRLTIVALGSLALCGCTGTHIKPPPVCDGKHRRPANLYGSVLPTLPVPLPLSQGDGHAVVTPPATPAIPTPVTDPFPVTAPPQAPASAVDPGTVGSAPAAPKIGALNSPVAETRTSRRDVALSYFHC